MPDAYDQFATVAAGTLVAAADEATAENMQAKAVLGLAYAVLALAAATRGK